MSIELYLMKYAKRRNHFHLYAISSYGDLNHECRKIMQNKNQTTNGSQTKGIFT